MLQSQNGILLNTKSGRKHISVEEYRKKVVFNDAPVAIAMADEFPSSSSKKRCRKGTEKNRYFHETFFGEKRQENCSASSSIKSLKDTFVFGVAVLNNYEENSLTICVESLLLLANFIVLNFFIKV